MPQPVIAFCTTCKGRTQHLEQTLPKNLADNESYPNAVFIVLDYNSQDHLLEFLRSKHAADIESGRVIVYSYRQDVPFQVAHAKNMAHRLGILNGAGILVNMDADNFTGPGFAEFIAEQFTSEDVFLWARMIQHGPDKMPRGINGRIVVSRKGFLLTGGYDERFATWSPDDKDFNLRLRRLGFQPKEIDKRFLNCIRHNDKMRFTHTSTHQDYGDEALETVDSCDTTVVNFGKIGCGTVYQTLGWRRMSLEEIPGSARTEMYAHQFSWKELAPLPTRIFGIGMHKTATTSLNAALKILGFDSAHWKSAHWAKAIFDEMNTWGRSLTLEKHYALSDLPIPILFEKLDAAYPGSKFILTIRDEDRWLQSVRNHWSHESNKFRGAWSTDPFTHKVHKAVYGQKGFDEQIFRARYRKHNADVQEYFRERPGDLLTLNMDQDEGGYGNRRWTDLCQFLGRPIPETPYPRQLVTPNRSASA